VKCIVLVWLLVASVGATAGADFSAGPLTLAQANARLGALRLVLGLPATVNLYRQYHAELEFSANDDLSHRREIGERAYCPHQVYVQATFEPSPEEHTQDMVYVWIVNVRVNKSVGPKGMSTPEAINGASLTAGRKCLDGSAPIPLPH
jgi:hypothetical protein